MRAHESYTRNQSVFRLNPRMAQMTTYTALVVYTKEKGLDSPLMENGAAYDDMQRPGRCSPPTQGIRSDVPETDDNDTTQRPGRSH